MPPADSEARLEVLIALAAAQRAVGANDRCCDTLAEAVELVAPGDNYLRVDLTAQWAASELFLGRHDQAQQRLAAVADRLSDEESPPGVRALLAQATAALFASDHEHGRELAQRGLAAARALDDAGLTGEAAATLAHVATVQGDVALGAESQTEAAALLEGLTDEDLALHLDAMHRLSRASLHLERYEDAVRIAARGVDVGTKTGRGEVIPVLRSTLAQSALTLGRLAQASEAQEAAVEAARLIGNDYVTCGILSTSANIALLTGRPGSRAAGRRGERGDPRPRRRGARAFGGQGGPGADDARSGSLRRRRRAAGGAARRLDARATPGRLAGPPPRGPGPARARSRRRSSRPRSSRAWPSSAPRASRCR